MEETDERAIRVEVEEEMSGLKGEANELKQGD